MSYTLQFDHLVLKPNLIDMTTPMCIHYIIEELYSKNENFRTRRIKISVEFVNELTITSHSTASRPQPRGKSIQ